MTEISVEVILLTGCETRQTWDPGIERCGLDGLRGEW
jgi:hypothetical protein